MAEAPRGTKVDAVEVSYGSGTGIIRAASMEIPIVIT